MKQAIFEWHPITGCSPASIGCLNCLAAKMVKEGGLTEVRSGRPVWNGELRFNPDALGVPASVLEPRIIVVCPHGDLFNENGPDEWIDAVFKAMEDCPHHFFTVLTKRSGRMRNFINARYEIAAPKHIHFGVSCERQAEADRRIGDLLQTKATVRYVTFYPLLGPIEISGLIDRRRVAYVLAGRENERPGEPEWLDAIRSGCAALGVPYGFGKILGQN